jgi:D-alanine-D-alanine ligase-like ATP-grasp enzyme
VRTGHAPPELFAYEIPDALGTTLVAATRALGLIFSGVDLRVTPEGRHVCFEINPSPGFTWYEQETGHPIADTVAETLMS